MIMSGLVGCAVGIFAHKRLGTAVAKLVQKTNVHHVAKDYATQLKTRFGPVVHKNRKKLVVLGTLGVCTYNVLYSYPSKAYMTKYVDLTQGWVSDTEKFWHRRYKARLRHLALKDSLGNSK